MTALKYLQAYPAALQEQVRQLIAKDQLGAYLEQRYPERHAVQSDKALYAYALALKQEHRWTAGPPACWICATRGEGGLQPGTSLTAEARKGEAAPGR